MSKIFSGQNAPSTMRSLLQGSLLALALSLMGTSQVQAQTANTCTLTRGLSPSGSWQMMPSGSSFRNGDVVGRVAAFAEYFMPFNHGDTVTMLAMGHSGNNVYKAVPLAGMPGLGLVVRWSNYYSNVTLTPLMPTLPSGSIISGPDWTWVLKARTTRDYSLLQSYILELVVIDERAYKGGKLTYVESGKTSISTASQKGNNIGQSCVGGWLDPMAALLGSLKVPELPKPMAPSCSFSTSTLYQNVSLGPVDPGQVVAYNSARSAGLTGQGKFTISATNCNVGTVLNLYFTDNRNPSSRTNYLSSSRDAVGVRLYYLQETTPVSYGPAPLGSSLPDRPAISAGPIPYQGVGVSMDFVAQYVRLPNTTVHDVTAGPVNAQAVFTIMYP